MPLYTNSTPNVCASGGGWRDGETRSEAYTSLSLYYISHVLQDSAEQYDYEQEIEARFRAIDRGADIRTRARVRQGHLILTTEYRLSPWGHYFGNTTYDVDQQDLWEGQWETEGQWPDDEHEEAENDEEVTSEEDLAAVQSEEHACIEEELSREEDVDDEGLDEEQSDEEDSDEDWLFIGRTRSSG